MIRGWSLGGHIVESQALQAFREFDHLDVELIDMAPLLPAAWGLRHNLSAHDAMYVALARAAQSPLLTLDAALAKAAPDCAQLPW